MSCLLLHGVRIAASTVFESNRNARAHPRYPARCTLVAQLRHQGAAALELAIAELSTTGALAARVIRLLRRGLLLHGATVPTRNGDVWVQRRCSAGRVLRAQLPSDSQL